MNLPYMFAKKKSQKKKLYIHFIICFYADGPYWDNIIQIPAYPYGYSYFRPFRYRKKWIELNFLNKIENNKNELIGKHGLLCMRFNDEKFKNKLLPLRIVKITKIDIEADYNIHFILGQFIDFNRFHQLKDLLITIPTKDYNIIQNCLFFNSTFYIRVPLSNIVEESTTWVKYLELLSEDKNLPINKEGKNSLFLRFESPRTSDGIKAEIGVIEKSKDLFEKHGLILDEGKSYYLNIHHKVPKLINTNYILNSIYNYEPSTNNIELDKKEEEYSSNYETHKIGITALRPSGLSEEIRLINKEKVFQPFKELNINMKPLSIHFKIEKNYTYRFKTYGLPILFLTFLFFINSLISFFSEGFIIWGLTIHGNYLIIFQVIFSTLLAIYIFLFPKKN